MPNPSDEARKAAQEDCTSQALREGFTAAAWGGATSGLLVAVANQYWPAFRNHLGVSGKTALIVSPIFGLFFLQSELSLNSCARRKKWAHQAPGSSDLSEILPTRGA